MQPLSSRSLDSSRVLLTRLTALCHSPELGSNSGWKEVATQSKKASRPPVSLTQYSLHIEALRRGCLSGQDERPFLYKNSHSSHVHGKTFKNKQQRVVKPLHRILKSNNRVNKATSDRITNQSMSYTVPILSSLPSSSLPCFGELNLSHVADSSSVTTDVKAVCLSMEQSPHPLSHPLHCSPESPKNRHSSLNDDKPSVSQLSFVLLKLREELPHFFNGDHSHDLYDPRVKFENRLGPIPFTVRSRSVYMSCLRLFRLATVAVYSRPHLQLIKITKDIETGEIQARWRVIGSTRLKLWSSDTLVISEGFSTFTVNSRGVISKHTADKRMTAPKEKRLLTWLAQLGLLIGLTPRSLEPQSYASSLGKVWLKFY